MARWAKEDEYRIPGDVPGTRYALLEVARKPCIYFMCAMALCGGVMFIAGFISLLRGSDSGPKLEDIPDPILLMAIGMLAFCLFFPMFLILYFGRHFLLSVMRLEDEIAGLKATIERR